MKILVQIDKYHQNLYFIIKAGISSILEEIAKYDIDSEVILRSLCIALGICICAYQCNTLINIIIFIAFIGSIIIWILDLKRLSINLIWIIIGYLIALISITSNNQSNHNIDVSKETNTEIHGIVDDIFYGVKPIIILKNASTNKQYIGSARINSTLNIIHQIMRNDHIILYGNIEAKHKSIWSNNLPIYAVPKINAQGFTYKIIQIERHNSLKSILSRIRSNIIDVIMHNSTNYGITIAMTTGSTGFIKKSDIENIRNSGLAHLLAISGLHIGIVAGSIFWLTRYILSRTKFCLYYDTKIIAAFFAIIAATMYLLITTMSISAVRSFIMFMILMICILWKRNPSITEIWSLSANIIMLFHPMQIFMPSFQMSFTATLALITVNKGILRYFSTFKIHKITKYPLYAINILISSGAAGLSIACFEMYHFNQISVIGPLANEIAIPLVTIILLPISIISVLLIPLDLQNIPLLISNTLGDVLLSIARYCAHFRWSTIFVSEISNITMLMHVCGVYFLMIKNIIWRIIGILLIVFAILIQIFSIKPNIIITKQYKHIAVLNNKQRYTLITKNSGDFVTKIFAKKLGIREFDIPYMTYLNNDAMLNLGISCNHQRCIQKYNDTMIYVCIDHCHDNQSNLDSIVIDMNKKTIKCFNKCHIHNKDDIIKLYTKL